MLRTKQLLRNPAQKNNAIDRQFKLNKLREFRDYITFDSSVKTHSHPRRDHYTNNGVNRNHAGFGCGVLIGVESVVESHRRVNLESYPECVWVEIP
ncbi:MAG: hypothetical protein O7D30_06830, partial [Rickettsia endosymbiont of Ixodes persulcatus]|nr:hypothetical protein [Rickettsia endosymbiont of Ixodes persulcatus]